MSQSPDISPASSAPKMTDAQRNRSAAKWMTLNVITGSLFPLIAAFFLVKDSPFWFATLANLFALVFYLVILVKTCPRLLQPDMLQKALNPGGRWIQANSILWPSVVSGVLVYPLFALAARYVDIVVVAIIFEAWPLFYVLMTSKLFQSEKRYQKLTPGIIIFFIMALVGLTFVSLSQLDQIDWLSGDIRGVMIGIGLALASSILNALNPAFDTRHGVLVHQRIKEVTGEDMGEINTTLLSVSVKRIVSTLIALGTALILNEALTTDILLAGLLMGVVFSGFGSVALRQANLKTSQLGINVLAYARPILSVGWIYLFAQFGSLATPEVPHIDYFIIGTVAIVASNILANFEASIRTAYKALIMGLWIGGAILCLGNTVGLTGYTEVVVSVATMFILLVSFRTERLVRRTKEEETLTLNLAAKINKNLTNLSLRKKAMDALERLDAPTSREAMAKAYDDFQGLLKSNQSAIANPDELERMVADTHQLAHSNQQGRGLGEFMALWLLGGLLIVILLFFGELQPHATSTPRWDLWIMGIISFVVASTVLFLLFNVRDLEKDRTDPIIADGRVVFRDVSRKKYESRLSWVMVVVMIATFAILLLFRWVY